VQRVSDGFADRAGWGDQVIIGLKPFAQGIEDRFGFFEPEFEALVGTNAGSVLSVTKNAQFWQQGMLKNGNKGCTTCHRNIPDQVDPSVPNDIDPPCTGSNCPFVPGQTDPSGIRLNFGSFRTKLTPYLGTEI